MGGGVVDEVVEVLVLAQQLFVARADLFEDVEEGLAAGAVRRVTGTRAERVSGDAAGLDVVEERGHQLRQPGDQPASQFQEQRPDRDALEGYARLLKLLAQCLAKHALPLLPAEGLDQPGPVLLVDVALPADAVDVPGPPIGRAALAVQGEVFDVDVVVGEVEVGPVLAVPGEAVSTG